MALELDIGGIRLHFSIENYQSSGSWCQVDFHVQAEPWLDYQISGELLRRDEADGILAEIQRLLQGSAEEVTEFQCMEPDFAFTFHPKKDLTADPAYIYLAPGYETEDIRLEWSVHFWNRGITRNRLTLALSREQILALRQYLSEVATHV